ncbi:hypothetical protein ACFWNN_23210 [Lentzea sp. NPDC058450]|uniref:wHTH domain-containing protein n=1 Tax=Lentzea sp. NPDC058450 TaxID=3346505 RepID=UPI0036668019
MLCAASKTTLSPTEVALRLAELGFERPPLSHLPDEVKEGDLILSSSEIGSFRSRRMNNDHWLAVGQTISVQHIAIAAVQTRLSPLAVRARLARLGFDVPPEHRLKFESARDDLTLLSADLEGVGSWLHAGHPALQRPGTTLPVGHVLAAAARIGVSPVGVVERLETLGLFCEPADLPARVDGLDGRLLRRVEDLALWQNEHSGEFAWLSCSEPADRRHLLICAGRTGLSPADVARRIDALGIPTADPQGLPRQVDREDLVLLSRDLDAQAPFTSLDDTFTCGKVLAVAIATRRTPAQVIGRCEQLGVHVSN